MVRTQWARILSFSTLASLAGMSMIGCGSTHPPSASSNGGEGGEPWGSTGGMGMGGGGGMGMGGVGGASTSGMGGAPPECMTAMDCAGTDSECAQRTCSNGICGMAYTPFPTPVAMQSPMDCRINVCDGVGGVLTMSDDTDLSDDGNECTSDVCTNGIASHPALPPGTTCTGGSCNGAGQCIGCTLPTDCGGMDSFCGNRTCSMGVCGMNLKPAGTLLPPLEQTWYDCRRKECDGAGSIVEITDPLDPELDGVDCTLDQCNGTTTLHPPAPAGTMCNDNLGKVCDGLSNCVECLDATHCGAWKCVQNKCTQCETNADCAPWQSCQEKLCIAKDASRVSPFGMIGSSRVEAMVSDSAGNLYLAGWFNGTVNFGGGPLVSTGDDVFVVKLDAQFAHVWSKRFGAMGQQRAHGLAIDTQGNLAVIGDFDGTLNFGGQDLVSNVDRDVFVAKLSAQDGAHAWSKAFPGMGDAVGRAVAIDTTGSVVMTGGFDGNISFGGATLVEENGTPSPGGDAFLVKLDASGSHQWSKRYGDGMVAQPYGDQAGTDVEIGENNAIWVAYVADFSINAGLGSRSSPGGIGLVSTLSPMGTPQDDDFVGYGPRIAIVPATYDVLVASVERLTRYKKSFAESWRGWISGMGTRRNVDVATDSMGNMYLTMGFDGQMTSFVHSYTSAGGFDMFAAKLYADGRHAYSGSFGAMGDQEGLAVAAGLAGETVVAGIFSSPFNLAGSTLSPAGTQDVFIAAFGP